MTKRLSKVAMALIGVLWLITFGPSALGSDAGEASHEECQSHRALLERIEKLERLVEALQVDVGEAGPVEVSRATPQPPPEPQFGSRLEVEKRRVSSRTFHAQTQYLPSRGWNADWQGLLEKRLDLRTFIDLEYLDAGSDGSRGGNSTFDTHHVQVFLDGQLNERLAAHAELEWEHSGDTVEVDQAYISWATTDWLTLDMGRFYTPFGIERFVWYSPTNALVSRPVAGRQIIPGNFYANGVRVGGVVGEGTRFTYEAAVSNGLGEDALENRRGSRQARDHNSNKALSGRVSVARQYFEVGASYHGERFSATDSPVEQDLEFVGFDVSGRYRGFELRAELIDATLDGDPLQGIEELEQRGWYCQLTYTFAWDRTFLPTLTLATRFDDVDLDRAVTGNDDQRGWSLGINAEVFRQMRLKAEYQMFEEDGADRDDDTFHLQAVITF